jgi:hypothetical protein
MGLFVILVQGFIFWRTGQSYTQVIGLSCNGPRLFSFKESQILSLAPGPVTLVRAFFPINTFIFHPPETITLKPFPCTFVHGVIQNSKLDMLALVLSADCFLTSKGAILSHGHAFCQSWRCGSSSSPFSSGLYFKGNFSSIFYQFTVHSTNWAHWICETLAVLVWLPLEVSHNSLIVWTNFSWRPGHFIRESLTLFGFSNNLCLPDRCFLFTRELWTLAGFCFNQPYPQIITEFRQVIVKQLQFPNRIPSKYFLMQRLQGQTRFLQNISEIAQILQMALPSLPWTVITYFPSIAKSAREFWEANLLFAVHGAGCGSLVFMQENTIFFELASLSCVGYMWQLTRICRIHHVLYMMPGVTHLGT